MNALFIRNDNVHRTHKDVRGGTMSAVHFGPLSEPVRLVFLNANGFNGLAYRSILEPLGVHAIGLDLRGHGHTQLPTGSDSLSKHSNYAADVVSYLQAHINEKTILAGHSLGANCAVLAACASPDLVEKVICFDPIILPMMARLSMSNGWSRKYLQNNYPLAKSAGRRRDEFASMEAAYKRFHKRGPFKDFPDEALWDYVYGGVVPHEDGVRLACRPRWEQRTYTTQSQNMKRAIAKLPKNSHLIITDFVPQSQGWITKMKKHRSDIKIEHRPDLKHFFPMTDQDIVGSALRQALDLS